MTTPPTEQIATPDVDSVAFYSDIGGWVVSRQHARNLQARLILANRRVDTVVNELRKFDRIVNDYEKGVSKVPWISVRESLAELMQAIDTAINQQEDQRFCYSTQHVVLV